MDKDIAFKADGLSKIYRLGVKDAAKDSIGSVMLGALMSPLINYRKYRSLYKFNDNELLKNTVNSSSQSILWALKDVSFEIKIGETVGIIGRNGAGKSTLLKVLSRITHPTKGSVEIRGKTASLLEVGTGFHKELTGRENVYLNGTILGMRKNEVDQKFDEIVDFSGVEKFLDTPVKRYSSGMRVRLAFAVAAHLEPEILIIDEVLAVGDAAFQKKCLNKMGDAKNHGRTVLFVSHNMAAISRLCARGILLENGSVVADGPMSDVMSMYMGGDTGSSAAREWNDESKAPGGEIARLRAVRIVTKDRIPSQTLDIKDPVGLEMQYDVMQSGHVLLPQYFVTSEEYGVLAFSAIDQDPEWRDKPRPKGRYTSTAWIPGNLLSEGSFYVGCGLNSIKPNITQFFEKQIVTARVIDSMDGNSVRGEWTTGINGVVRPMLDWKTYYSSGAPE